MFAYILTRISQLKCEESTKKSSKPEFYLIPMQSVSSMVSKNKIKKITYN